MKLRAISVRQPWASLLLTGVKRFECRSWRVKQPGVLLVHASGSKAAGIRGLRQERAFHAALLYAKLTDEADWPFSAIIGAVEIARFWEPGLRPRALSARDAYLADAPDSYLWEVSRRWPFVKPVSCKGKLGLWQPDATIYKAVRTQLAALGVPCGQVCA